MLVPKVGAVRRHEVDDKEKHEDGAVAAGQLVDAAEEVDVVHVHGGAEGGA